MSKVLGVGAGIFVLGFIWLLGALFCIIMSRSQGPAKFGGVGGIVLAVILTVILWFYPRELPVATSEDTTIYDPSIISRFCILALEILALLMGLGIYFTQDVQLRYHAGRAVPHRGLASS